MDRDALVAWAAGFVDGEGSIFLVRYTQAGGSQTYGLRLSVGQVDPEPLFRLKELWGGAIQFVAKRGTSKADSYMWCLAGALVVRACKDILPYLTVKRHQAELAIDYAPLQASLSKRSHPLTVSDIAEREEYRKLFSAMNKTGVSKPMVETKQRPVKKAHPQLRLLETS